MLMILIALVLIALVLIALGLWWAQEEGSLGPLVLCIVLAIALIVFSVITIVPAGHVKVATLFGEVQQQVYREGLHMVNPRIDHFDYLSAVERVLQEKLKR